jgi:hypothetical protein
MMVRPASFGFNPETASSNAFQSVTPQSDSLPAVARKEFDQMVNILNEHDISVHVFDDTTDVIRPDAVFPNNWITFHHDGKVILYPMLAPNRRAERRRDFIDVLQSEYVISELIDLSEEEGNNIFLEGTGSMVFDHANNIVYACRSPRTNESLLNRAAEMLTYRSIVFDALDEKSQCIYHTNVMMNVSEKFAVVCLDSVRREQDQDLLLDSFERTGHKVIAISFAQMNSFAGNMFSVKNRSGESFVLMSQKAFDSLLPGQINEISKYSEILPFNVENIERYGGGSVRCMVAGIFLPRKDTLRGLE